MFWLPLALSLLFAIDASAKAPHVIYRRDSIGSDATFNPVSHYFNLAFDTTQNPYYFSQSRYLQNHEVLWNRIKDPFAAIENSGGYRAFASNELVGLRAIPNYTLHLIGGGYDYRWLAEWYEARNVPYPYVVAFANAYLANIGNEALETSATQVGPGDHVADLFLFDIAGKLLFLSDDVVRFFHDTLKMRGWHFQPMFNLRYLRIDNAGSNYIFRPELFGRSVRPFFQMGMTLMTGASFRVNAQDSLTPAIGMALTDPLLMMGDVIGGVFWDRDDSLLASLVVNGSANLAVRLNVYPDVLSLGNLKVGYYVAYSRAGGSIVGVNLSLPIGVSVSSL